jgi:transcription elongation factor Elf1
VSNFFDALQASLQCPKCGAANRPGATLVELSEDRQTACCGVCAHAGLLERFQLKEKL